MKTYHQLFTLVMLILVVLTAVMIIRIAFLTTSQDVINKAPSKNIIKTSSL